MRDILGRLGDGFDWGKLMALVGTGSTGGGTPGGGGVRRRGAGPYDPARAARAGNTLYSDKGGGK